MTTNNKKIAAITCHLTTDDHLAVLNLAAASSVSASEWVRDLIAGMSSVRRKSWACAKNWRNCGSGESGHDVFSGVGRDRLGGGVCHRSINQRSEGDAGMSGFWIGVIYAVLVVLLVGLIAYLCERAQDDDQWPQ